MGVFTMPSLGADMEAGTLVEWLVKPGDKVHRGDVVAVVETQKGAIEVEVFEEGTVQRLEAEVGKELPVGAPLALIAAEGEEAPEPATGPAEKTPAAPEPATGATEEMAAAAEPVAAPGTGPSRPEARPVPAVPPARRGAASPAARARAAELGLDISTIEGSGPGGAVLLADIEAGARGAKGAAPKPRPAARPMDEMRKAIAAAMTRSKQTIPHFYLSQTIDIEPATRWLEKRNADAEPDERILLGALFVRAAALAAQKVKVLNGHYGDDGFVPSDTVNPGVAVALRGGGLVAPAIMDAPSLSLDETMAAMRDLVARARAGRLRSSEMTQGTITVSALGETGAETMTGVIFPPQVALVGLGAPQTRPWVVDGAIEPRSVVTLTVSADHRVADGRQSARFIAAFEALLQSPEDL